MSKAGTGVGLLSQGRRYLSARLTAARQRFLTRASDAEKEFIEMNRTFWEGYAGKACAPSSGFIFVRPEQYPLILVGNAQISSFIAVEKNLGQIFLIPDRHRKQMMRVLGTFPGAEFIFQDDPEIARLREKSRDKTREILSKVKTPEEILEIEINGMTVGDLIYDNYLAAGYATVREIDRALLSGIVQETLYQYELVEHIVRRRRIEMGFTSHMVGIAGGVFSRYLLRSGIEVWERESTLKKHCSYESAFETSRDPDRRYIDYMRMHRDYFLPLAENCIMERLCNIKINPNDRLAYAEEKRVFESRDEFCLHYGLDPSRKNVFVMLHAFNDFPHTYGGMIFRDFYEWFTAVLEIAREKPDVNWIFKDHPYAKYYPTKDLDMKSVFEGIDLPNVVYFDEHENFNTSSLRYVADALLTCIGTAGLEYSCFGVPCILAGRCWYSGFGFTLEPRTAGEFRAMLDDIHNLPRLDQDQIETAKLFALFIFDMVEVTNFADPFSTVCTFDIDEQFGLTPERIFETIVAKRRKSGKEECEKYIRDLREFVVNTDFVQYVDLEKCSRFRDVICRDARCGSETVALGGKCR